MKIQIKECETAEEAIAHIRTKDIVMYDQYYYHYNIRVSNFELFDTLFFELLSDKVDKLIEDWEGEPKAITFWYKSLLPIHQFIESDFFELINTNEHLHSIHSRIQDFRKEAYAEVLDKVNKSNSPQLLIANLKRNIELDLSDEFDLDIRKTDSKSSVPSFRRPARGIL